MPLHYITFPNFTSFFFDLIIILVMETHISSASSYTWYTKWIVPHPLRAEKDQRSRLVTLTPNRRTAQSGGRDGWQISRLKAFISNWTMAAIGGESCSELCQCPYCLHNKALVQTPMAILVWHLSTPLVHTEGYGTMVRRLRFCVTYKENLLRAISPAEPRREACNIFV